MSRKIGSQPKITDQQRARIALLRRQGVGSRALAVRFGCSQAHIDAILRQARQGGQ